MKIKFRIIIFVLAFFPITVFAEVTVNALFTDHMVVQRSTEIPIWGWADPNEKVEVIASWGERASVITGADGTWKLKLKTPNAGGPFQIAITGKNTIIINDVLSGEVWLCTGQSNMDFDMARFAQNAKDPKYQSVAEYNQNEIKTANDDWIRHIEVPQTTSLSEKKTNFKGSWRNATPEQIGKITATGYFFAKELRKQLKNVPIGLVECSWGGTRVQPWISEETYLENKNLKNYFEASRAESKATIDKMEAKDYVDVEYQKQLTAWEKNSKKGKEPKPTASPKQDMQLPATLHNGMLSAVIPFAIKGAIWYQGESNAAFLPNEYEAFFTAMIKGWRKEWKGDFSFYWVQLAACKRGDDLNDKGWATVNDQLRRTLKLPKTGMAVLYDIGEPDDIHPHNKRDAGKRLALWALQKDYKIKQSAISGPLYKSMKVKGDKIEIEFNEVGSGLMVGNKNLLEDTKEVNEPLKWFEIVGEDGVWQMAEAKIISNNKIEVSNTSVSKPIHVRYAWSGNPEGANLYNKEGLPTAVFSSENR